MNTRAWRIADGAWRTRSVLECGDWSSLSASDLSPLRAPSPGDHFPATPSCDRSPHSKTWRLTSSSFCFLLSALCFQAWGQFSINWSTIDGGGATSTGGVYSLSGTIGQSDAGAMSGGSFTLVGGFWALPGLVQTPGAPTLCITNAAPDWATLWWSPPTPGFVLQENLSLSTTNWVYSLSGATNPVGVPATLPAKFYRLHKP